MNIESLGVPEVQAKKLRTHLKQAEKFVYPVDPGMDKAIEWLYHSLFGALDPDSAQTLYQLAVNNKPDPTVEYIEQGYDSCQSNRKLSKVVSEAILQGGLAYEAGLLGLPTNGGQDVQLAKIAQKYGSKQDFIFPGVTPSSADTPSLEELAYQVLKGTPTTTVRSLTGVGGLRSDKDWNYVTDLATFVDLKVAEDKRYYPGAGIFYYMMKNDLDAIPAIAAIKGTQPDLYGQLKKMAQAIKGTEKQEFAGVSVLCSAYIPQWEELKAVTGYLTDEHIELAESFHSPSYEFGILRAIFEQLNQGKQVGEASYAQLKMLTKKLNYCWSFNSTIHLPWTAELADLSNEFFGKITNQLGDTGTRYGVGYQGKSMEVREYVFGGQRSFPSEVAGKRAYQVRVYPHSDNFAGEKKTFHLDMNSPLAHSIKEKGFMRTALCYLQK